MIIIITALHYLLLKTSGSMSDFLECVNIFLRKNSELIMKDTKQKLSELRIKKQLFKTCLPLTKRKASSEKNYPPF